MNCAEHGGRDPASTARGRGRAEKVLALLRDGNLPAAVAAMHRLRMPPADVPFKALIDDLEEKARSEYARGEIRTANRLKRRSRALVILREHGLDPERLMPPVDLPEGYRGKILLVLLSGGLIDGRLCLRSGDLWHREILKNTEEEIRDSGFFDSCADAAGGASVRFEDDGGITLWGSSDEFGACDKNIAAAMVAKSFPGRKLLILK